MVRIASLRSCSNCMLTMCVSPRNGLPASIVYHERSEVVSPATALDRLRSSCGEAAADGQVLRAAYPPAPGRRMTSAAATAGGGSDGSRGSVDRLHGLDSMRFPRLNRAPTDKIPNA